VRAVEVEIVCSDGDEHRRRVEARTPDIEGHTLPAWADVVAREYHRWDAPPAVVDTAHRSPREALDALIAAIG
jgi:hypothetical protein